MSESDDLEEVTEPSPPGAPSYLRAVRRAAGLSQAQLAERANLAVRTISIIESGDSNPRAGTLTSIAAALHIDARELIGAFATNTPPTAATPVTSDRYITVATADLSALFDAVTEVTTAGGVDDRRVQTLTSRAGRLFTDYAVGLLEHAIANPQTHRVDTIAGLIRLQLHQFPDVSDSRGYLAWLLGDTATTDADVRYRARRSLIAPSRGD